MLKSREEYINWLTRVVIQKVMFHYTYKYCCWSCAQGAFYRLLQIITHISGDMTYFTRVGIFNSGLRMTDEDCT